MNSPYPVRKQSAEQPEQSAEQVPARPSFTLSQAADVCRVSRSRIRRMLDAGAFPNASRPDAADASMVRPWLIPLGDLLAAGLSVSRPPDSDEQPEQSAEQSDEREVLELRHALDLERTRRLAAEDGIRARDRAIEALELALRLIEAGTVHPPEAAAETPPAKTAEESPAPEAPKPAEAVPEAPEAPRRRRWPWRS